jgi:hypothetical protein
MNFDDPHIRPKDFLYAVMRDVSAPIADRVKAACHLLEIEFAQPRTRTKRIIEPPSAVIQIARFPSLACIRAMKIPIADSILLKDHA